MTKAELYTDEWGVTYTNGGRTLQEVNPQLFTCEEYTVPEGVEEVMDDAFLMKNPKLRKIHFPSTLRKLGYNTFLCYPLVELELPEGVAIVPGCMCENCAELQKVVLPSSIEGIEICAFNCCTKLQMATTPECPIANLGHRFMDLYGFYTAAIKHFRTYHLKT